MRSVLPSPNGRLVAFIGRQPISTSGAPLGPIRTALVLAGDGTQLSPADQYVYAAAWFPDGRELLVATADELDAATRLTVVDLQGGLVHEIPIDVQIADGLGLAINPDGDTAVVPGRRSGEAGLWQIDLESGASESVSVSAEAGSLPSEPAFVDSGRLVVVVETAEGSSPSAGLHLVDLRSGDGKLMTPADQLALSPSVTPDSEFVVYEAQQAVGQEARTLWYLPLDGSAPPQLIKAPSYLGPALESSGEALLSTRSGGGPATIIRTELPTNLPWLGGT